MSDAGVSWARLIRASAEAVFEQVDELTILDSGVGDGDHGVNLCAGFQDVVSRLDADQSMTAPQVLQATGHGLQESMAGTAGLLFGRFFAVAGRAIEDCFDGPTISTVLTRGTAEVVKRGRAGVGDRSMIDALDPAAQKARELGEAGVAVEDMLASVAAAAREGAEGTAHLAPRVGRAARATRNPTGQPDAGATSIALILEAWATEQTRSTSDV